LPLRLPALDVRPYIILMLRWTTVNLSVFTPIFSRARRPAGFFIWMTSFIRLSPTEVLGVGLMNSLARSPDRPSTSTGSRITGSSHARAGQQIVRYCSSLNGSASSVSFA